MPLTVYRRHARTCKFKRRPRHDARSQRCKCMLWVQGSLGPDYVRTTLNLTVWEAAQQIVRGWEAKGRIEGWGETNTTPTTVPVTASVAASQVLPVNSIPPVIATLAVPEGSVAPANAESPAEVSAIEEAVDRFLASLKKQNLSWETLRKYEALLKRRLLPWCARTHYVALRELGVAKLDDFRDTWNDSPIYATKNLERLRAFFQFCVERDWIAKNPAKAIRAPQVDPTPTLPYTIDEMDRILAACRKYRGDKDRMRAFVLAMRYSGLRISDTVALHSEQLIGHRLRLYTTKTGQAVYVPLPPFVVEALKKIERPSRRYFSTGRAKLSGARTNWSRYLQSLFRLANIENGHSHRFRDTFSCSLLEQGVPVETVAMLLGNTPAIVIKHYAPWIKSRQIALEAAVQTTWQSPSAIADANVNGPTSSERSIDAA